MLVGDLDTWPVIVGIGKEREQWREEEWSMEEKESRRYMNTRTI